MSSTTDQQSALQSQAGALRQKQIATLNADRMNVPKKIQFSFHITTLIISIIQIFVAYIFYTMMYTEEESTFTKRDLITQRLQTFQIEHSTFHIVISAVAYLILCAVTYHTTDFKTYLQNAKNVRELNNCYNKIKNSGVSLTFQIQCYHYERKHRKNQKQKIVTHKATKIINFSECYDLSGFLKPQVQKEFKKNLALIEYKASYQYLQKEEEAIMNKIYQWFVANNKRDQQQDHKKTFKFTDCQSNTQQAYFINGEKRELNTYLLLASLFCLTWPVAMLIEFLQVERYEVTILKKVKLDETQQGYKQVTPRQNVL